MSLFKVEKNEDNTGYISISEGEKAERSITIPDSGLVLDFSKDDELIGVESIDFEGDFPDKFIEEFEGETETKPLQDIEDIEELDTDFQKISLRLETFTDLTDEALKLLTEATESEAIKLEEAEKEAVKQLYKRGLVDIRKSKIYAEMDKIELRCGEE